MQEEIRQEILQGIKEEKIPLASRQIFRITPARLTRDLSPECRQALIADRDFDLLGTFLVLNSISTFRKQYGSFMFSRDPHEYDRDIVVFIDFPAENPQKQLVIKAHQGDQEGMISTIASQEGFGPEVFENLGGCIVEERLRNDAKEAIKKFGPKEFGIKLGKMIRQMHDKEILFGDAILRHIHRKNDRLVLIDFGIAKTQPAEEEKKEECKRLFSEIKAFLPRILWQRARPWSRKNLSKKILDAFVESYQPPWHIWH